MKSLLIALLIVGAASCKKENVNNSKTPADPEKMYGKWTWVSSMGGFAGKTTTPQSAGYQAGIEFKRDKTVSFYRNDTLTNTAEFNLAKGKSIFSADSAYIIKYKPDAMDQAIIKTKTDTLILADNVYDGFTITYVRDK
ncbi:MAG: hypothetical protein EOP54_21160 [Sphingobacteriales bacterium]|nr:MAG: hypothetical protein EOP54_21160 [Sphingobacteriales bacterium]